MKIQSWQNWQMSGRETAIPVSERSNRIGCFSKLLKRAAFLLLSIAMLAVATASAQTYSILHSFSITNVTGFDPNALIQGADGMLYGTTSSSQGNAGGVVYKIQPDGTGFTVLRYLTNSPASSSLFLAGDTLYGLAGGPLAGGALFKLNTDGTGFTWYAPAPCSSQPLLSWVTMVNNTLYGSGLPVAQAIQCSAGSAVVGPFFCAFGTNGQVLSVAARAYIGTPPIPCPFCPLISSLYSGPPPNPGVVSSGSNLYGTKPGIVWSGPYLQNLHFFSGSEGTNVNPELVASDPALYGTTYDGGSSGVGLVFKINTTNGDLSVLKSFSGADGATPNHLVLSGGTLFGTTSSGGDSNLGTVFKVSTDGSGFATLTSFTGGDGADPYSGILLSGGVIYGTTRGGGASGQGVVFRVNTNGSAFTVLADLPSAADGGLVLSGAKLCGIAPSGGSAGRGMLFAVSTNGGGLVVLKDFVGDPGDVANPCAGLLLSGGMLYGTSSSGGSSGNGTVFKVNRDGSGFGVLKTFAPLFYSGGLYTNSGGATPLAALAVAGSGLYGTASSGGTNGMGAVFRLNMDGSGFAVLRDFGGGPTNGANPQGGLLTSGTTLYGTTYSGGISNRGTVFKINTDGGNYAVLGDFTSSTNGGSGPEAGLALSGSTLYGTTFYGGSGYGTVFKVSTDGNGYAVLKAFMPTFYHNGGPLTNSGGANPRCSLSVSGSTLYGTTSAGGANGYGTIFKLNTDGNGFSVLRDLTLADGSSPYGGLLLSGSTLYGAAYGGGSASSGTVFAIGTDGTGFTVLKNLAGTNGVYPRGNLIFSGGTLYGTASLGGVAGVGTVFSLTAPIPLTISAMNNAQVLSWSDPSFALQSAPTLNGSFADVPGATSPYTNRTTSPQQFFRLKAN